MSDERVYGRLQLKSVRGVGPRTAPFESPGSGAIGLYDLEVQLGGGKVLNIDVEVGIQPLCAHAEDRYHASLKLDQSCNAESSEAALLRLADWMERAAAGLRVALGGPDSEQQFLLVRAHGIHHPEKRPDGPEET